MSYTSWRAATRAVRSVNRTTTAVALTASLAGAGIGVVATAGSASAAATAPVINSVSAGYAAGNIFGPVNRRTTSTWRFRYASATTRLPNPNAPLNAAGDTMLKVNRVSGFAVHLANTKQTIVAGISWGGSSWNVNVAQEYAPTPVSTGGIGYNCNEGGGSNPSENGVDCSSGAGFANQNQFQSGVTVRLDLYYNRDQGSIHWYAYQNGVRVASDAFAAWTPQSSGGGAFTEAFAGADFSTSAYTGGIGNFTRPAANARLFLARSVHFTSYNGTKGTVVGPWLYSQLMVGTSHRNIYANAPNLFNSGQNFGVLLRS